MFIAVLVGVIAVAVACVALWKWGPSASPSRTAGSAGAESARGHGDIASSRGTRGASEAPRSRSPESAGAVSLREVIAEMIEIGQEQTAFLDRVNGELVTLDDELRTAIEAGEQVEPTERFDAAKLAALKEMFKHGQLLELPTRYELREFAMREEYARQVSNSRHRALLIQSLQEKGAFRAFEQTLRRLGLRQDWDRYRDQAFEQIAIGWLESHKIAYDRGPA